jgi:hypothetical protein
VACAEIDSIVIYVDSGAGQSMCSCSSAFADMIPCEIEITGVAGSLQVYGCGTALFLVNDDSGQPFLLRISNCLYGHGQFNLLSVSQMCQNPDNCVDFKLDSPAIFFSSTVRSRQRQIRLPLALEDGLFAVTATPFQLDDSRFSSLRKVNVTLDGVFKPSDNASSNRWNSRLLVSTNPTSCFLVASPGGYDHTLQSFCSNFLAPPNIPASRRQYDTSIIADLSDLTTRFLGLGTDRLKRTVELSNGLRTPASKPKSNFPAVRPFFPHGRWAEGKTPRVSKNKVGSSFTASPGEAVFTDTFASGDTRFAYGQAFFDMASHWGDIFPLRSRNDVGQSFADFCCRNWVPLYLIRDNIGENIGGSLIDECRSRNVKSLYICPRHPQQNYAEGYLGRVTAMASFAMVFSGAPLFMWIFAIRTAVFISNISASYYSKQKFWSTPYFVLHGEHFPDASIVVPFGCAALVLRDSDDRAKFQNRAVMMLFVHYSEDHPLFTYALYSPRTKRVLHRQDVIFLTSVFPMRVARVASGMGPEGDPLTVFRSPESLLDGCPADLSFGDWSAQDSLPLYDDDVSGFPLYSPYESLVDHPSVLEGVPVYSPCHPSFAPSSVLVPIPAAPSSVMVSGVVPPANGSSLQAVCEDPLLSDDTDRGVGTALIRSFREEDDASSSSVLDFSPGPVAIDRGVAPRRSARTRMPTVQHVRPPPLHRLARDRWTYEPIVPTGDKTALLSLPALLPTQGSTHVVDSGSAAVNRGVSVDHGLSSSVTIEEISDVSPMPTDIPPYRLLSSLLLDDGRTGRFQIRLSFPNAELPDQFFMVTTAMTVPVLESALARLMQTPPPLFLFVAPRWELLNHAGSIVTRFLPDRVTPCPYLQPGSILRVIARRDLAQQQQLDNFNSRPVDGGFSPHDLLFGLPAFPLVRSSTLESSTELDPAPTLDFSSSLVFLPALQLAQSPIFPIDETSSSLVFPIDETSSNGEDSRGAPQRYHLTIEEDASFAVGPLMQMGQQPKWSGDQGESDNLSDSTPPLDGNLRRNGESKRNLSMVVSSEWQSEEQPNSGEQRNVNRISSDGLTPCLGESSSENDGSDESDGQSSALSDRSEEPSPKRPRTNESLEEASDEAAPDTIVMVSRRERAGLLKKFKQEQKAERRKFKSMIKLEWEEEMAAGKENLPKEGDAAGSSSSSSDLRQVGSETIAEAYEDYLFDKMMRHDGDAAHLLVHFRASLRVASNLDSRNGELASSQRRDRTDELFEGLRRTYFGEKERQLPAPNPVQSHQEVMEALQREIDDLERRRGRPRVPEESNRPLPSFRDEDNDPRPPSSVAHTNVAPDARTGVVRPFSIVPEPSDQTDNSAPNHSGSSSRGCFPVRKMILLSRRVLRRIMAAKESLFKFGTFVPKNHREAESSPEAARWRAGRELEWVRLGLEGTFDGDWTWRKAQEAYPNYKKSDIGYLFYVYDFKFSGEHRVRLVFDGSRQSETTYKETYAPTVRAESVRLFHIYCVTEGLQIGQYDVPQAFLKADIDHDIFVYPPTGQSDFPGQILKLKRALYGGKQSAFLWFTMMNTFLLSLGFKASPLDNCFYLRPDAVLILYCDDLRIGASPCVLISLHAALKDKFGITTAPGNRFLGMDCSYDLDLGILKLSMASYVVSTMDRFKNFDLSQGYPYRELVGCLLWITLNVMGPELLRVKDLARMSNSYGEPEYNLALKVLHRIYVRRDHGIVMFRNGGGKELIPSSERSGPVSSSADATQENEVLGLASDDLGDHILETHNEITKQSLCRGKALFSDVSPSYIVNDPELLDIQRVHLPINSRYSLLAYGDASFAIGTTKQSVTGFIVYLNGVPLLWGSLKQTVVVDSSCSAEFVAASVTCKHLLHAENMIGFLGFSTPKPYRIYTDSKACYHIATNPSRLGNVRHLEIRYHMVRCYVTLGDVEMCFCITEEMIADLLTKVVVGAQDQRLSIRFYSLFPGSSDHVSGTKFDLDAMD